MPFLHVFFGVQDRCGSPKVASSADIGAEDVGAVEELPYLDGVFSRVECDDYATEGFEGGEGVERDEGGEVGADGGEGGGVEY